MVAKARLKHAGTVVEVLRDGSERPLTRQVDWPRIDATTEAEIAAQIAEDDAEAMRDAGAYARHVRRKVGLSQVAFARRIGVPVDTVRNWEQGRRAPQGPARALLRIIDRVPSPRRRSRLWTRPEPTVTPSARGAWHIGKGAFGRAGQPECIRRLPLSGRVRYWGWVPRLRRWLRVVTLEDGSTVHNAFLDRRFKP